MEERFVRNLVKMARCATCGRRYSAAHVNVLGHQDDLWFLSVLCPACQTQGLMAALVKEQAVPPVADARPAPADLSAAPVGANDVLAMREFLQTFDGNFARLFRGGREGRL
ncbi:MAG: hypothetical protein HY331_13070 [Chloroflexi bacterium]|nr:hypothetical protein [Chloroflexota bacterium]